MSDDSAAKARILRQTEQLHQYHLEVKQKISHREHEVYAMIKDMLEMEKRKGMRAKERPERPVKTVATSPPPPLPPLNAFVCKSLTAVSGAVRDPCAPAAEDLSARRAAHRVPALRIKGQLPAKEQRLQGAGVSHDFLFGAADSLSLMLTGEQRRWRNTARLSSGGFTGKYHTESTTADSLNLSPIRCVRPSVDVSALGADSESNFEEVARLYGPSAMLEPKPRPPPNEITGREPKRVRFSSKSPQVELFSVERTEVLTCMLGKQKEEKSPAIITMSAVSDRGGTPTDLNDGPETQPKAAIPVQGSPTMRNSVREVLSAIDDLKRSLSHSGNSSGGSTNSLDSKAIFNTHSLASRTRLSPSAADHSLESNEESGEEQAATPSPPAVTRPRDEATTFTEKKSTTPQVKRSTRSVSTSPELVDTQRNFSKKVSDVLDFGDSTASPIFLRRGRPHLPSFGHEPKRSEAVRHGAGKQGICDNSVAVDLSSISAQQASCLLEPYIKPHLYAALTKRGGKVAKAKDARKSKDDTSQRVTAKPKSQVRGRIQSVSGGGRVFESEGKRSNVDDGTASSAAISLACGPTLYFN